VKVVFAGARALPLAPTARYILAELVKLPGGSQVLLRRPKTPGKWPGEFELLVSRLAGILGVSVEWRQPEGIDRSQTYLRDLGMVEDADYVVAFFAQERVMEGGTGHVVEAAWSKLRAVEAYTIGQDGDLIDVGSFDPTEA